MDDNRHHPSDHEPWDDDTVLLHDFGDVEAGGQARGHVAPLLPAVPGAAAPTLRRPVVAPTLEDPVVRAASTLIGGPVGHRLGAGTTRRFWHAGSVLLLLASLVMAGSVVGKEHCRARGWSTPDMFWHACYSDTAVLYSSAGLGGTGRVSLSQATGDHQLGGPVTSVVMWVAALATDSTPARTAPRRYFDLSAGVLTVCLLAGVAAVGAVAGRRRWDAAHLALSPVLLTAGLISYELLGVALLAVAMALWGRRRTVAAGVVAGVALGVRPLVAIVAVALLALAVRTGRTVEVLRTFGTTLVVWLGLRLVLLQGLTGGLGGAWRRWRESGPGYGSLWLVPQLLGQSRPAHARFWYGGGPLSDSATTVLSVVGTTIVVILVAGLALLPERRPRLAPLALVAVAGGLLVSKGLPPQASLLMLPLIALSGLRWRDHLIWAATEMAYFVGVWLYIAGQSRADRGLPAGAYLVLLLARLAGIAWVALQAARTAAHDALDPVRNPVDGGPIQDDPAGGAFDGAADVLVVRVV